MLTKTEINNHIHNHKAHLVLAQHQGEWMQVFWLQNAINHLRQTLIDVYIDEQDQVKEILRPSVIKTKSKPLYEIFSLKTKEQLMTGNNFQELSHTLRTQFKPGNWLVIRRRN